MNHSYFENYVLTVKMNLSSEDIVTNVNAYQLYESAIQEGIVDVEDWPDYIHNKMTELSVPKGTRKIS